jgi:hypothetical protein
MKNIIEKMRFSQNSLNQYINESKNFKLEDDERQALSDFIGIICGNLGDDNEQTQYKEIIDSLEDKEVLQLRELHDCLDDNETYKSINRNTIIDDITLIKKLYKLADDNDLLDEQWDLIDAFEKICL